MSGSLTGLPVLLSRPAANLCVVLSRSAANAGWWRVTVRPGTGSPGVRPAGAVLRSVHGGGVPRAEVTG
ncbi:hypothetical protein [Streptomyces sp. NPDC001480]|uniref:hypothetical protein n=1 Tax=Streptomyces sp. NPDC001480 TaxID=3364577 RepID=UPI0036893C7A